MTEFYEEDAPPEDVRKALELGVKRITARPAIICPACGLPSRHAVDILHRYCPHCHAFHDHMRAFLDEGAEVRARLGITGTAYDAQGVPHPFVVDEITGRCLACALARSSHEAGVDLDAC